jgi:DNA-binding FrmR family transcriptional regulator
MTFRSLMVLALAPAVAVAQTRHDSHAPIRPPGDVVEPPSVLLGRKLAELQCPQLMGQLLKNPAELDAAALDRLRKDPAAAEVLRRLMEGDPALMKLAQQIAANHPALKGIDPELLREKIPELAREYLNREGAGAATNSLPSTERNRLARAAYAERIEDLLRDYRLDGVAGQLRDSPLFRDWLHELTRSGNSSLAPVTVGDFNSAFATALDLLRDVRQYLPSDLPALPKVNMSAPAMPVVSIPSFGLPSPSGSAWGFAGDGWSYLAAVVGVIVLIVAVARASGLRPGPAAAARARLGPWPVAPDRITSREDVIAAFEYLAVWKFGPAAAAWNHRTVADRLAAEPDARPAADRLADLYEKARYAAAPQAAWDSARELVRRLI